MNFECFYFRIFENRMERNEIRWKMKCGIYRLNCSNVNMKLLLTFKRIGKVFYYLYQNMHWKDIMFEAASENRCRLKQWNLSLNGKATKSLT